MISRLFILVSIVYFIYLLPLNWETTKLCIDCERLRSPTENNFEITQGNALNPKPRQQTLPHGPEDTFNINSIVAFLPSMYTTTGQNQNNANFKDILFELYVKYNKLDETTDMKKLKTILDGMEVPQLTNVKQNEEEFVGLKMEERLEHINFFLNNEELKGYQQDCQLWPTMIFYNRIGKAGSSSLKSWMMKYSANFHMESSPDYDGTTEHLTEEEEKSFVTQFLSYYQSSQNLYERHVHFINFEKHGFSQPAYINMMREPGARYISQYYFWYGMAGEFGRKMRNSEVTLIDCLMKPHDSLDFGCPMLNYQTLYFCGNAPECTIPPTEQTYLLARKNILHHYSLIGTLERFNDTTKMLKKTFPSYFATNAHSNAFPKVMQNNYTPPPKEVYFMASIANHYDLLLFNLVDDLMNQRMKMCKIE